MTDETNMRYEACETDDVIDAESVREHLNQLRDYRDDPDVDPETDLWLDPFESLGDAIDVYDAIHNNIDAINAWCRASAEEYYDPEDDRGTVDPTDTRWYEMVGRAIDDAVDIDLPVRRDDIIGDLRDHMSVGKIEMVRVEGGGQ